MNEQLKELIKIFHQGKVVEKILESERKMKAFNRQKRNMKKDLNLFKQNVKKIIAKRGYVFETYDVLNEDALQLIFICIMTGIPEDELIKDWRKLQLALYAVKGKNSESARKLASIMENTVLTLFEEEALLKQIV